MVERALRARFRSASVPPDAEACAERPLEAVAGAEALVLATGWKEFANEDLSAVKAAMHTPLVFDGRNLFDPATMKELGFLYNGVGRQPVK